MHDSRDKAPAKKTVYMTYRQATALSALLIFFCLASFLAGYFLGKNSVLQEFGKQLARDSFSDHVEYAFIKDDLKQQDDEQQATQHIDDTVSVKEDISAAKNIHAEEPADVVYYAKVIGFGNKKSAQAFCARLKKKNILMLIKTRVSQTSEGKKRIWYQVVTKDFNNKVELETLLARISKFEHIKLESMQIMSRSIKKDSNGTKKTR